MDKHTITDVSKTRTYMRIKSRFFVLTMQEFTPQAEDKNLHRDIVRLNILPEEKVNLIGKAFTLQKYYGCKEFRR